jgi:hypothetical protein
MFKKISLPLALLVAAAVSAHAAVAQHGNGHGHGNGDEHGNSRHAYKADRDDDDDNGRASRGGRYDNNGYRLERRVPPGWCQGRGNPHNTVENCGQGSNRYDRRYDPRYNGSYGYPNTSSRYPNGSRYGTGTYGGSYGYGANTYSQWKRLHDQQCRDLARQRPLDLRYQLQVRQQCAAQDRAARQRYGV